MRESHSTYKKQLVTVQSRKSVRKCQEIPRGACFRQTGNIYNLLNLITLPVGFRILDPTILFPAPPSDADPVSLSLQQMHPRSGLKPVAHFALRFQVNAMGFTQSNNRFHCGRSTVRKFVSGVDGPGPFIHSISDEFQ